MKNPKVAATFIWSYYDTEGVFNARQVRFNGIANLLSEAEITDCYAKENIFSKIRSLVGVSGTPTTLEEIDLRYNQLKEEYQQNKNELKRTDT